MYLRNKGINIIEVLSRKEMIITSQVKNSNRITIGDCSKTPGSFRAIIEQKAYIHNQ